MAINASPGALLSVAGRQLAEAGRGSSSVVGGQLAAVSDFASIYGSYDKHGVGKVPAAG